MEVKEYGTIGVLMGGYSSEREISLKSGQAVCGALNQAGCTVKPLDITWEDEKRIAEFIELSDIDVAFLALHGRLGEDGTIQSILEKLEILYTGSGPAASRIAINKARAQEVFKRNNIPVSDFEILIAGTGQLQIKIEEAFERLGGFPLMVKPACEGSSIGLHKVEDKEHLMVAIKDALRYGSEVIVERFIKGRELTVGILAGATLPIIEIRPENQIFDFAAKYQTGTTEYLIPAPLSAGAASRVQKAALDAFNALGCSDFSRVDVMLDDKENPFVLEINTIPGFTAMSLLPKAARAQGIEFPQLCLKLIDMAYGKKK